MNFLKKIKEKLWKVLRKYFDREKLEKFPIFYINGSQTLPPPLSVLE